MFSAVKDLEKTKEILGTKEQILYECQVFKRIDELLSNYIFLRIYETFILLSNCKSFSHFKIAYFDFKIMVNFKFECDGGEKRTILKSFELIIEDEIIEFSTNKQIDLINIRQILKSKMNFLGFHEQFRVIKKIGKGNFAIVYLSKNLYDQRLYAVKSMSKIYLSQLKDGMLAFQNETDLLRQTNHINLIKLDSIYETTHSFYLVLELFSGGNLKDYIIQKGFLCERNASIIMKQILKGIQYLHAKNIMHRDIKPENILFRNAKENAAALADFGLATSNNVENYIFSRCGTPGYVAPEVNDLFDSSRHYDLKCDLYSFGVTLFYALTGQLPYPKKKVRKDNVNVDFKNLEIYFKLSNHAKDLLSKLICHVENRLDVTQALDHDFFKYYDNEQNEEETVKIEEGEFSKRQKDLIKHNIQEFNARKFIWDKKNIFAINPISSPLKRFINKSVHSSETLAKPNPSLSFVRFTPIFSGYTETVKSITDEENICLDEESYYENIKSKAFANIKLMKECKLMKK